MHCWLPLGIALCRSKVACYMLPFTRQSRSQGFEVCWSDPGFAKVRAQYRRPWSPPFFFVYETSIKHILKTNWITNLLNEHVENQTFLNTFLNERHCFKRPPPPRPLINTCPNAAQALASAVNICSTGFTARMRICTDVSFFCVSASFQKIALQC